VTKGDQLVERGATRLQELADKAAARGDGIGEWLSEELRNDAAFLRKLKPSLVKARAQGNASTNQAPAAPAPSPPTPPAPAAVPPPVELHASETETQATPPPKPKAKKKSKNRRRGGPPPIVIVGAALVAGVLLAKVVDWRGHAHPRD
jgi:hypothetical protein